MINTQQMILRKRYQSLKSLFWKTSLKLVQIAFLMNNHKQVSLNLNESSSILSRLEYQEFKLCTSSNWILHKIKKQTCIYRKRKLHIRLWNIQKSSMTSGSSKTRICSKRVHCFSQGMINTHCRSKSIKHIMRHK